MYVSGALALRWPAKPLLDIAKKISQTFAFQKMPLKII
jgi:hypothetical protein